MKLRQQIFQVNNKKRAFRLIVLFFTSVIMCFTFLSKANVFYSGKNIEKTIYQQTNNNNLFIDNSVLGAKIIYQTFRNIEYSKTFHLFSHGRDGELFLDNQWRNAEEIRDWLQHTDFLNNKTYLNIYGCEFAESKKGRLALQFLEKELGVHIAASDDITGKDGDWDLEIGQTAQVFVVNEYAYNLQNCCNNTHGNGAGGHNHVKSLTLKYTGSSGNVTLYTDDNSGGTGLTNITKSVNNGDVVIFAAAGSQKYGSNSDWTWPGGSTSLHTSCSQADVVLGAKFGPFEIIGIITANGCSEGTLNLCSDIISAGSINGGETYCAASANPSNISSAQPASGGSGGNIEYRWQYRNGTSGNWLTINNATSANYNPSTITQTRQYRRGAKRSCSSSGYIYTDKVTFSFSSNITNTGSISGGADYCTPTNPPNITNAQSASGGSGGSIEYRWQYRNGTSGSWLTINNATSSSYNPPTLSQTRQYRRGARRTCSSSSFSFIYGNKVTYTVSSNVTDPGRISGGAIYCVPTNPPNITNAQSASGGNIEYRWQYRNGTSGSWTTINNETSSSYNPPTLSQTTQYRRGARSSCTSTSLPYINGNIVTFSFPVSTTDTDGDGIPDVCDDDDDNDGIFDINENICGTLDSVNPVLVNTGGPFTSSTLTTVNGQVFTWKTTSVSPGNSVRHFITNNGRVSYKSSNAEPLSTAEVFDVEVTFPTPTTTFQIKAWDFDGVYKESIDNFSVEPTQLSSNAQNISGRVTSTGNDEDIDLFWNLSSPVSSLTFSVNRPSTGLGIFFSVGFPFCDTDNDGTIDALDSDSDGDGCFDVVESGGVDANNNGVLDGSGFNNTGRVTGGSGGYDGTTGKEIIAHRVVILTAPGNQTKNSGESTSFTGTARGDKATNYNNGTPVYGTPGNANNGINYQWYIGTPSSGGTPISNGGVYSGATTSTLSISDVTGLDGKEYCLVVTHNGNVCSEEVRCATLSVNSDEICGDGIDNDGDGLTDCADPDCGIVTSATSSPDTCALAKGSITFSFSDNSNQTTIEFSIDGGNTWPYAAPDNSGSFTVNNVLTGSYNLQSRWSDQSCPKVINTSFFVGDYNTNPALCNPSVSFQKSINVDTASHHQTVIYTFSIFNNSGVVLNNVNFTDVLGNGGLFFSNAYDLTNGIQISGTAINSGIANLTLNNVQFGNSSFKLTVDIPEGIPQWSTYCNQANISNLKASNSSLPDVINSDDPTTTSTGDPTCVLIKIYENCCNGIDDDGDGKDDCDDSDCN